MEMTKRYRKRLYDRSAGLSKPTTPAYILPLLDFQQAQPLRPSQLLHMPVELRLMMYDYLFRGNVVHVFTAFKKVAYICCNSSSSQDLTEAWCTSAASFEHAQHINVRPAQMTVSLLLTCRQLYMEVIPFLYGDNVFNVEDLKAFISFSKIIRPPNLAAIIHLDVHWAAHYPPLRLSWAALKSIQASLNANSTYLQFWRVLANQMPGLRELRFVIDNGRWLHHHVSVDDAWIGPLKEVKGLARFDLGTEGLHLGDPAKMQMVKIERELRMVMCTRGKR